MALKIGADGVVSDAKQLQNIASLDATTTTTIQNAIGSGAVDHDSIELFNSSGTWQAPTGVTSVTVLVVGGGGGGKPYGDNGTAPVGENPGTPATSTYPAARGGYGGRAISINSITVTPGSQYNITVGAGGAGSQSAQASGSNGGTSTAVFGPTTISATGGQGAVYTTEPASSPVADGTPGTDGVGSGGDYTNINPIFHMPLINFNANFGEVDYDKYIAAFGAYTSGYNLFGTDNFPTLMAAMESSGRTFDGTNNPNNASAKVFYTNPNVTRAPDVAGQFESDRTSYAGEAGNGLSTNTYGFGGMSGMVAIMWKA